MEQSLLKGPSYLVVPVKMDVPCCANLGLSNDKAEGGHCPSSGGLKAGPNPWLWDGYVGVIHRRLRSPRVPSQEAEVTSQITKAETFWADKEWMRGCGNSVSTQT